MITLYQLENPTFRGASSFEPEQWNDYRAVAEIEVSDLDEAFHVHNCGIEEKITRLEEQHSMSVGDILCDGTDYFMVDRLGFAKIAV